MFLKLFWYDIRVGILQQYRKWLIAAAVFTAACLEYLMEIQGYSSGLAMETYPVKETLGNCLLFLFRGMQEYSITLDKQFTFPAIWMLMYLLAAYFTLYYPYHDLEESGQHLLLRSGGRRLWWISKCVWNLLSVGLFFGISWIVTGLFCLFRGVPLTMELSENMAAFLEMRYSQLWLHPKEMTVEILLLPMLVMMACCLLQMTLSLFLRPIFSFMVTGTILLASVYYQTPALIGNYAMTIRNSKLLVGGMDTTVGILFSLGILAGAFLVGLLKFKRYDILRKENVA